MQKKKQLSLAMLAAIGVVFGDLGTSPLYTLQAVFHIPNLSVNATTVYGAISLIIWTITLVVTVQFVCLIMRADNNGEGGIMALVARIYRQPMSHNWSQRLIFIGLIGAALFYGDSVITPAISVLSAVEGTAVVAPHLQRLIIPIALTLLLLLFIVQRRGTGAIGRLFGPIMVIWFLAGAVGGLTQLIQHPAALIALSPHLAIQFLITNPVAGFVSIGAVMLAVTGAEALFADMGHFGRTPISRDWLWFVFPALALTYLGQGALVAYQPGALTSPYFLLFPHFLQLPAVILATAATLIASQAVISGAFSMTHQAMHLGFLPRMNVLYTSAKEMGQVYLPLLNWIIAGLVAVIIIGFGSSAALASMYGFAISGVLVVDSILFLVIMRKSWHISAWLVFLTGLLLLTVNLIMLAASSTKLLDGAWLPILLGGISLLIFTTWQKGHQLMHHKRKIAEGTLPDFIKQVHHSHHLNRPHSNAIYLSSDPESAPLALHRAVEELHELPERVLVLTVETDPVPHVPIEERVVFDQLGSADDGISHATIRFGFKDTPNVPHTLQESRTKLGREARFDPHTATYYVSLTKPAVKQSRHEMSQLRKLFYSVLARNSLTPSDYFHLPVESTVEITSLVEF